MTKEIIKSLIEADEIMVGGKYYPMEEAVEVFKAVSTLFGRKGGRPKKN